MTRPVFFLQRLALAAVLALAGAVPGAARPQHGIAMYGDPALPPDFAHLPHANPDAPRGGRIVFGESGGFDSLNPFILKGRPAAGLSALTVETLMGRSYDEPFTLYGLLAETVETDPDRSWVEFTLREGARFSDGSPVTVDDVLWSFRTLGTVGHPRYLTAWKKIASAEATGPRSVRFTFNTVDRELPLILGLRPILKRAQWEGRDFAESPDVLPLGSGPYVVAAHEPGRYITYRRNPDWWGADLPFNRGQHNFDEIRYDYFGDAGVVFEAFKAGAITTWRETNPAKWATNYDFPAVRSGAVVKSEIPHGRPSGILGFAFNTRKPLFADWRVREALITAFNFDFVNQTLNGGALRRIESYFSNSVLGMQPGTPATGREAELLAPFAADLPPGTIEGYALPVSDGTAANRAGLRRATDLLAQAGWTVQDGVLKNPAGVAFAFEMLLQNGQDDMIAAATIWAEALQRLGIAMRITTIDSAQMTERTNAYDFDMTYIWRSLSLSPGNEQTLYWGSAGADTPGSRNLMGMKSPAADAMVAAMLASATHEDFVAATRALDRVLTAGRYVVPLWYSHVSRLAHAQQLRYPSRLPIYGDWLGFQPDVWWHED